MYRGIAVNSSCGQCTGAMLLDNSCRGAAGYFCSEGNLISFIIKGLCHRMRRDMQRKLWPCMACLYRQPKAMETAKE